MKYLSASQIRAKQLASAGAGEALGDAGGAEATCDDSVKERATVEPAGPLRFRQALGERDRGDAQGDTDDYVHSEYYDDILPEGHFDDTTATSALGHHTVLTPLAQGRFLEHLSHYGNVRQACGRAGVSAQTLYRARRASAGFARAWDAARVNARGHAEEALAERALYGWEEPVFYHGEEIARKRRYSDRLLLAHLGRLDRLADNEDVAAGLALLDGQIAALLRGEGSGAESDPSSADPDPVDFAEGRPAGNEADAQGEREGESVQSNQNFWFQDTVPSVPSCRTCPECGGECANTNAELGPDDCQWLGNRLDRMNAARPDGAASPHEIASGVDATDRVEMLQLEAFEAGTAEWWLITAEGKLEEEDAEDAQNDQVAAKVPNG